MLMHQRTTSIIREFRKINQEGYCLPAVIADYVPEMTLNSSRISLVPENDRL
jgi:hypothetical protein